MKKLIYLLSFIVILFFLVSCDSYKNEKWDQFRGNNASGVASLKANPPIEFGEDQNLFWKIELPFGNSSPVIWNNKIFLTGFIEEKNELQTICINRKNGEYLWVESVFPETIEKFHSISSPAQTTIAADESSIYVFFGSDGLRCYDHNGVLKWHYPVPVTSFKWGHPSSPIVVDDKLIINLDYGTLEQRHLLALNKTDGSVIWKAYVQKSTPFETSGYPCFGVPGIVQDQIILHRSGGIASYSLNDGSAQWWIPLVTNGACTPIVYNDIVYVGGWGELGEVDRRGEYYNYDTFEKAVNNLDHDGDKLISMDEIPEDMMITNRPDNDISDAFTFSVRNFFGSLDSDKNGLADGDEWKAFYEYVINYTDEVGLMAFNPNLKGEIARKDILWMQPEKNPEVPTPIANDNCIYTVKNGGWVTCTDAQNGNVWYQEKLGSPGAYIASPVMANEYIYLSSHNGTINVIKTGKNPEKVFETKLEGQITATPAIAGKNLYIRTSKYLYAFGK